MRPNFILNCVKISSNYPHLIANFALFKIKFATASRKRPHRNKSDKKQAPHCANQGFAELECGADRTELVNCLESDKSTTTTLLNSGEYSFINGVRAGAERTAPVVLQR
jgi:hypothetical protein